MQDTESFPPCIQADYERRRADGLAEELRLAKEHNVVVVSVPGVSSAFLVLSAGGCWQLLLSSADLEHAIG